MKLAKMLGIVLLSVFISATCVGAFEVERRGDSIIITKQNPQVELVLSRRAGALNFDLKTAYVTLRLSKSVNEEEGRAFIRCTSNSTNKVVTFSDREYALFSLLLDNIDLTRWDEVYNKFLSTSINLFQSWPSNALVFAMMSPERIIYYQLDGTLDILNQGSATSEEEDEYFCPDGKELNYPTPKCENLCFQKGELIEGHILYLGDWVYLDDAGYITIKREGWTESFEQYVGIGGTDDITDNESCFGRCGKGCPGDLEGRITYTQRCFNHDGCVDECGYLAENCFKLFVGCSYDYLFAPICYEIWVSSILFKFRGNGQSVEI